MPLRSPPGDQFPLVKQLFFISRRASLESQVHQLQQEIALAERKVIGVQEAIDSRKKTLARLQSQLCLEQSPVAPAPIMSACRTGS